MDADSRAAGAQQTPRSLQATLECRAWTRDRKVCEKGKFATYPFSGSSSLDNKKMEKFSKDFQVGRDFLVLTRPHLLENYPGGSYRYPCPKIF